MLQSLILIYFVKISTGLPVPELVRSTTCDAGGLRGRHVRDVSGRNFRHQVFGRLRLQNAVIFPRIRFQNAVSGFFFKSLYLNFFIICNLFEK